MAQKFINNWSTTLIQPLAPNETVIHLPTEQVNRLALILTQGDYCLLTMDHDEQVEIVKVIAINGSEVLVERAQEGTIGNFWGSGSKIEARITAGTLSLFQSQGSSPSNPIIITEFFEGPGEITITAAEYRLYFGGPGLKVVHLPSNLSTNQRHTAIIHGQNTEGSAVTVQIGDNNVSWHGGTSPNFPPGSLVETMLFTLDGGNEWYGKILGTY